MALHYSAFIIYTVVNIVVTIEKTEGLWRNKKKVKRKNLRDNMNPIKRVYIVLFVLPDIRGPP